MLEQQYKVLVKEKIADSGVELLRREFGVELGLEMSDDELRDRIGEFDGIVIRSATKLSADLIERGSRLKVIGRGGDLNSGGKSRAPTTSPGHVITSRSITLRSCRMFPGQG